MNDLSKQKKVSKTIQTCSKWLNVSKLFQHFKLWKFFQQLVYKTFQKRFKTFQKRFKTFQKRFRTIQRHSSVPIESEMFKIIPTIQKNSKTFQNFSKTVQKSSKTIQKEILYDIQNSCNVSNMFKNAYTVQKTFQTFK